MWRNKFGRVLTVQAVCLLAVPALGWAQGASANGASASGLTAGETLPGWGVYALDEAQLLWQHSENAAGVDLDSTRTRGFSAFQFVHQGGDFHRVQEGRQTNEVGFVSERYQRIGKYLAGYGRFEFQNGRTTHRAWSDVVRTYWSNPFLSGSSVAGSYDTQEFAFQARVGTVDLHGFRYGVKLDYTVGDLSRLRDPRSRSRRLDYQISPSVTYSFGKVANSGTVTNFATFKMANSGTVTNFATFKPKHTLGAAAWYHRYKEKIPNLITVQSDPNLYYYTLSGLEAVSGTIGGYSGYSREYVNHEAGGELQYALNTGTGYQMLNTLSLARGSESMFEQYEREAGHYYTYLYKVGSMHRWHGNHLLHQLDAHVRMEQAYADEYRPQLEVTLDANTGYSSYRYVNLMTYRKRYQFEAVSADAQYALHWVADAPGAVKKDTGSARDNSDTGSALSAIYQQVKVRLDWNAYHQKHLLPTSTFDLRTLRVGAEYGRALLPSKHLWLEGRVGYQWNVQADLDLGDTTTEYAQSVLLPDLSAYYNTDCMQAGLSIRYEHAMHFKGYRFVGYVKGWADTWRAHQSMSWQMMGVTVGILQ